MPVFHSLKISNIRKETEETVSIAFDVPQDLHEEYQYNAGQYLTLKSIIDGEDTRRSYSICSGLYDNELRVAVKKIKDSTPGFVIPVANALTEETIRVEEITKEKMRIAYYGEKPRDLSVFVRGDAGRLGKLVPRRFLQVFNVMRTMRFCGVPYCLTSTRG